MSQPDSERHERVEPAGGVVRAAVQGDVNKHFDSTAAYWDRVYLGADLQGAIYRQRQVAVLAAADAAGIAPGARVLEIGCGAGHLTIQLAERGLRVEAVDASPAMVDATAQRVRESGLHEAVNAAVADVHALPFGDGHFDLVIAVGVIPWLHSPDRAVGEMARVVRAGGQVVLTADNRARLISFTDPRAILALTPLKRVYDTLRKRSGVATSKLDRPRGIDRLLQRHGMRPVARRTVGFGPLSFLGRPIVGDALGVRINERLQALADRDAPGLRWTGWHYVVRAVKPGPEASGGQAPGGPR